MRLLVHGENSFIFLQIKISNLALIVIQSFLDYLKQNKNTKSNICYQLFRELDASNWNAYSGNLAKNKMMNFNQN